MRPSTVVMGGIGPERPIQMTPTEDERELMSGCVEIAPSSDGSKGLRRTAYPSGGSRNHRKETPQCDGTRPRTPSRPRRAP